MTEPSMCGGDAALCQITLTTCYFINKDKLISVYCLVHKETVLLSALNFCVGLFKS